MALNINIYADLLWEKKNKKNIFVVLKALWKNVEINVSCRHSLTPHSYCVADAYNDTTAVSADSYEISEDTSHLITCKSLESLCCELRAAISRFEKRIRFACVLKLTYIYTLNTRGNR